MKKVLLIALGLAFLLVSCGGSKVKEEKSSSEEVKVEVVAVDVLTLTIASEQADCTGVGPQKCFLIKKDGETSWSFWYSGIKDFNYEPGFEYVIDVKVETVANAPADASTINYTFVKEVSKTQKQSEGLPVKK